MSTFLCLSPRLPCSPLGTFTAILGSQTCNACPAGEFSNTTAARACRECGPGEITVNTGSSWQGATECTPW